MKTLILTEPNKIEYVERSQPKAAPDEVLLKINSVGICGTDIHAYTGNQPFFSYPRVLGHEICGTAAHLGEECSKIEQGERYVVIPCVPCGECPACHDGRTNCCESVSLYGVHQDGGFSEYLAVKENNLVKVPKGVDSSAASVVECFAISAHASRRADIKNDENVLVVGAGPIGLAAAAIAKAEGANVVVADIDASRRAHIETSVGVKSINPMEDNYVDNLSEMFGGVLADTVMDATGNKHSMSKSVELIRHGGKIVFIGLYIGNLELDDPTFHKKETTLLSSRNATIDDFETVLGLMADKKISADMMINKSFDFETIGNIYSTEVVNNKEMIKGVINF
ncbi:zinc-binding alcohol dehydrogenase family protein [Vibrio algivorus]|uniref:Galactonate oxidoreductase n=1 Tax=Vibrio algivorus TaxID=1667024 RepID=A0ABQ6ERF5_9VIBR|nr:zinc-binding alcohol dehydrogenase family protein [Vibrio algivorus]GLT15316.1 galactonate oxidoreductase [Vibrio algivorus]